MPENKNIFLKKPDTTPKTDHYLVGIGASAGGLEAIHKLFDHFPGNSSFSFVIIQHLSPDHKSLMAELLSKHTSMQVREAEDNMLTQPNCVYVLPSGKQLTLEFGRLRLVEKERNREPNFAINIFFESLAKDMGRYAIGVVLSGTGTDGTKGCEAIKAAGGMVVVQDPKTAKFDGMPNSAIDAGALDYVLPPEHMGDEIIAYTKKLPLVHKQNSGEMPENEQDDETILEDILDLVWTETQSDFRDYKQSTIYRRIHKRMDYLKVKTLHDYLVYLQENGTEAKLLCQEFLIGVTSFFRDPEAFQVLEKDVIPKIVESKAADETAKVWVTACSTGEEVYSMAILFLEYYKRLGREPLVKLFATDIDKRGILHASKGSYPASISKNISKERLKSYFYQKGNRYIVNEEVRKLVVFAQHDIQKDPPFGRLDLISCRNMLIYLNPGLQKKVLSLFSFALNINGYLMLGPSEYIGDLKSYFIEEDRKWKVYKKVEESKGIQHHYGISDYKPLKSSDSNNYKVTQANRYNEAFMDAVSEDFKITGFYVDENYQLLHGIGDINRFLQFPNKRLHFNLLKMVPEELGIALSVGIRKVLKHGQRIEAKQVSVKLGGKNCLVKVSVKPVSVEKNTAKLILVLLQEVKQSSTDKITKVASTVSDSDYYQQLTELETELKEAREGLHLSVQDLSTANEELQSTNEELMSSNEELQSSNEEMQSLNEELHTVNAEHQLKIKELQELNEDLDNYIRSTNVGQLFVDHNLSIRKYTPTISSIINIIDSDLGRPVYHLSHNLKYTALMDDIRHVNNTSQEVEQEMETADGKFFLMRIIPYLKFDGNKDGIVMSFVDITTLKTLSNVVQGVLNSSLSNIIAFRSVRDKEQKIVDFTFTLLNKPAEELIGKTLDSLKEISVLDQLPYLKKEGLFRKFVKVTESGEPLHIEQKLEINGQKTWYEVVAVKMGDGITVTMTDITEKKSSEDKVLQAYDEIKQAEEKLIKLNNELEKRVAERTQALAESEERFRLVSMATNDVVWDWDMVTNELWWSESLVAVLGYTTAQMGEGINGWFSKVHPEDRDRVVKGINDAINAGKDQWSEEYRIAKQDGTYAYISNRAYIMHNEYGIPNRVLGSFIDLSDLKATQVELESTNEHLLRVNEDLDMFVYTASHDLKAPMANIEGLLLLLEDQIDSSEPIAGEPTAPLFEMLKNSIHRFKNVIKDLTDIAKVQRDVDGQAERVAFKDVLSDVKVNIKDLLEKEQAKVMEDFEEAPYISFSKKNLYSILYNLVSNAVKYRSPHRDPEVQIKTEQLDGFVLLTVKDNGLGMSTDSLPKLFTLFKRFHSHVDGTGMGLYIVKRMIDNAGGRIEVESEEGKGFTLKLYFKIDNDRQLATESMHITVLE